MKKVLSALTVVFTVSLPLLSYAEPSTYTELLVGIVEHDERLGVIELSDKDVSLGFRMGFSASDYFAVELGYFDYGELNDSVSIGGGVLVLASSVTSTDLGIKAMLPITNQLSFNGRVGFSRWDFRSNILIGDSKGNDDGVDPYYGVGAQYIWRDRYSIGLEYKFSEYDVFNGNGFDREINNLSLSFSIKNKK